MVRPRWRRRLLVRAGALALGALVAFVVLELFVRAFVDLAAQRAIPVHGVDPENPVSFLPGFAHTYETPEFTYTVRFNSWGRRDVEWTEAAIADPESVLLIGDSFVLGNGLEHEDTIASGLERFYASHGAPREVLNFGLPGGGPAEYARLFEDGLARGVAARTVVVVVFVGNDFYESGLDDPAFDPVRRRELAEAAKKVQPPRLVSHLVQFVKLRAAQETMVVDAMLRLGRLFGVSLYRSPSAYVFQRELAPSEREIVDGLLAHLRHIHARCTESGRALFLVAIPNKIQVESADALRSATLDPDAPSHLLRAFADELGVPLLDVLPLLRGEFERTGVPLYYPIDRHLNPTGARLVTDALARLLTEG